MNDQIRARQVRVIDEEGEQLGIMSPRDALQEAEQRGYDLVEVAPKANPPVCRIMDYGMYRYEQKRRAAIFSDTTSGDAETAAPRQEPMEARTCRRSRHAGAEPSASR